MSRTWYSPQWNKLALTWTPGGGFAAVDALGEGVFNDKVNSVTVLASGVRKDGGVTIVLLDRVLLAPPDLGATTILDLPRMYDGATLMPDDSILLTNADSDPPSPGLRFDPVKRTSAPVAPLNDSRFDAAQARLADGRVLMAGGWMRENVLWPAFLAYAAAAGVFAAVGVAFRRVAKRARPGALVAGVAGVVATIGLVFWWVSTLGRFIPG